MYKDGVLTISDWTRCIGDSAYTGFQNMRNVDPFSKPGVLRSSYRLTNKLQLSALPVKFLKASNGDEFTLISSPGFNFTRLYKNGNFISTLTNQAWDMIEYQNYILFTYDQYVGAYGPINNAPSLFLTFQSGLETAGYYHKILAGQDDIVYITNGNKIASISSFSGGTPGVVPTATLNTSAMGTGLPKGQYGVTMTELGKYLMIGTQAGASFAERNSYKVANIYPWDRSSSSFNLPVQLNDNSVSAMITVNNILYVVCGGEGNIYRSDFTNYRKIRKIPVGDDRPFTYSMSIYPNAIALGTNGNLLIGNSYGGGTLNQYGVYEMSLSEGYPIVLKNTISTGNYNTSINIGSLLSYSDDYLYVGWQDGSTFGLDHVIGYSPYTNFTSFVESPIIHVGTIKNKKSFNQGQFLLGKPFVTRGFFSTPQGIKLEYRKNNKDSYTTIGTYTYATVGGVLSSFINPGIKDAELVQLKISINQDTTSTYADAVELMSVSLW